MAYEIKNNTGSLFRNDRKKHDKSPDYTGKAMIDGKMYYKSAWVKEANGKKYFSEAYTLMEEQPAASETSAAPAVSDDEIPF